MVPPAPPMFPVPESDDLFIMCNVKGRALGGALEVSFI